MKKNLVYVALSVFGVQGAAYLGQFILAGMLSAEQFAVVRTVEASLQLLSAFAPLGVSLLVVRLAAQTSDPQALGRLLSSYLAFALVAGIAVACVSSMLIAVFSQRTADPYLLGAVWVLALTNISRTALNFLYGKERFATVSVTNFIIALCYLAALVVLVKLVGLPGWIGAKYLIETAFLVVSLVFLWRHLGPIISSARLYVELASEGLAVSLSLMFRTGLDTMPLLILTYLGANAKDVATFGLCTLMVAAAMILPGSLNTVLLPKYARMQKTEPDLISNLHSKNQKILTVIAMITAILLAGVGFIIDKNSVNKFINLSELLAVLAISVPLKAIGSLNANLLFSKNRTTVGTKIHAAALTASIFSTFILIDIIGVWGAIIGTMFGELIAYSLLIAFVKQEIMQVKNN